jgi:hypothetical protein
MPRVSITFNLAKVYNTSNNQEPYRRKKLTEKWQALSVRFDYSYLLLEDEKSEKACFNFL